MGPLSNETISGVQMAGYSDSRVSGPAALTPMSLSGTSSSSRCCGCFRRTHGRRRRGLGSCGRRLGRGWDGRGRDGRCLAGGLGRGGRIRRTTPRHWDPRYGASDPEEGQVDLLVGRNGVADSRGRVRNDLAPVGSASVIRLWVVLVSGGGRRRDSQDIGPLEDLLAEV